MSWPENTERRDARDRVPHPADRVLTWRLRCLVITYLFVLIVACSTARAAWSPPSWWLRQAFCIHTHESVDWHYGPSRHRGYASWNGYFGGYQFTLSTWRSADRLLGRHDDPQWSSPWVQTLHAYAIWLTNGHSWRHGQWPTSSVECGAG